MITAKAETTIILSGAEARLFSLMCKTFKDDAGTRLTRAQLEDVRAFAERCNCVNEIWGA